MQNTAYRFYRQVQDNTATKYLPGVLASACELAEAAPCNNVSADDLLKLYKRVSKDFVKNQGDTNNDIMKVKTLLYAYLLGEEIPASLEADKDAILEHSHRLLNGLLNIVMEQRFVTCTMNVIEFSQLLTQGLWFHSNQLLQLPWVGQTEVRARQAKPRARPNRAPGQTAARPNRRQAKPPPGQTAARPDRAPGQTFSANMSLSPSPLCPRPSCAVWLSALLVLSLSLPLSLSPSLSLSLPRSLSPSPSLALALSQTLCSAPSSRSRALRSSSSTARSRRQSRRGRPSRRPRSSAARSGARCSGR